MDEKMRRIATEAFVVAPLTPVVDRISRSQSRRAEKYLGTLAADIGTQAWQGSVRRISQSKWDMKVLIQAADSLKDIPYYTFVRASDFDDVSVGKARGYILNTFRKEAVKAINRAFDEQPTLDSIDKSDTMLSNFTELDDPDNERFHADRNPVSYGSKFPRPGEPNWSEVSMVVATVITAKNLDRLTEVLLDENNLREDGSFMWAEHGIKCWEACGLPRDVYFAAKTPRRRANLAKRVVRNRFAWLPRVIDTAVENLSIDEWHPRTHITQVT